MPTTFQLTCVPLISFAMFVAGLFGPLTAIAGTTANPAQDETSWQESSAAYARIMSQVRWTPVAEGIPAHPRRSDRYFEAGRTYTGVPSSNGGHDGRYIGFEIFLKTFLAAVENPQSVLYTEDLRGQRTNSGAYYGLVCSAYTSYALQSATMHPSRGHIPPHRDGMEAVESQSGQSVEVGDVIFMPGHVEIVTQVTRNADGEVTHVRWEDSAPPTTRTRQGDPSHLDDYRRQGRIVIPAGAILTTGEVGFIVWGENRYGRLRNRDSVTVVELHEDAQAKERRGTLEDGTEYLVRRPANWNGVVICDLDLLPNRFNGRFYQYMYHEGYGLSGTARRHPAFPLEDNLRRVQEALAIFRAEYGQPDRVLVYGRSRGGLVALSAAELLTEEVDAAVAIAATTPALTFNQAFDFFFILKALLAPQEPGLEHYGLAGTERELREMNRIRNNWSELLQAVHDTREGKARMALAFAMAQYAGFGGQSTSRPGVPKPDIDDPQAVAEAMFEVVRTGLINRLGNTNRSHEPIGQYVGNEGIDYAWYYHNISPDYRNVVETLYREASLDIEADIEQINNEPRVATDPEAPSAMFDHPGRTHRGTPQVPLFRMDNIADVTIPTAQTRVYTDNVRWNGLDDLYRTSVVGRGGHAFCTLAEKVAAIRVVEYRLDHGVWPDSDADSLNALAASLDLGDADFVDYERQRFSGQWRLHAYSRKFDLSYDDLGSKVRLFRSQGRITQTGHEQLLALLLQAEQHGRRNDWREAKKTLAAFVEKAGDSDVVPDDDAVSDLAWDARLLMIQMEREVRDGA